MEKIKPIAKIIGIILGVSIVLDLVAIVGIQVLWWIPKNKFALAGQCVNHFGEQYDCTLFHWVVERGILNPLGICCHVAFIGFGLIAGIVTVYLLQLKKANII